jgi:hypothetical protein
MGEICHLLDGVVVAGETRRVGHSCSIPHTRTTVELLKKHGLEPAFKESPGVHSLIEHAPQLF